MKNSQKSGKCHDGPGQYVILVAASQILYGEQILATVAGNMQTMAQGLSASGLVSFEIRPCGAKTSRTDIAELVLQANADQKCIGVIIHSHTFSPGQQWHGLQDLAKPLLHLNTWFHQTMPFGAVNMDFMNTYQAAHGDVELANGLDTLNIRRHPVYGHWESSEVQLAIDRWVRAASAAASLRGDTVVTIGGRMDHVVGTEMPSTALSGAFGISCVEADTSELVELMRQASASSVQDLLGLFEGLYSMHPTTRSRQGLVRDAARQELGIKALLGRHNARCWTSHFNRLKGLKQLPGLAAQRSMADGQGFGPEGDRGVAVLGHACHLMSGPVPVWSLGEPYVLSDGGILLAHMAEVSPLIGLATRKPSLEVHHLGIGDSRTVARLVFTALECTSATIASLVYRGGKVRLVAASGSISDPPEPLPKLPVGHAFFKPAGDLSTFLACWQTAGGSHHHILSYNLGLSDWRLLAGILGIEFVEIDHTTEPAAVHRSLAIQRLYPPLLY